MSTEKFREFEPWSVDGNPCFRDCNTGEILPNGPDPGVKKALMSLQRRFEDDVLRKAAEIRKARKGKR